VEICQATRDANQAADWLARLSICPINPPERLIVLLSGITQFNEDG